MCQFYVLDEETEAQRGDWSHWLEVVELEMDSGSLGSKCVFLTITDGYVSYFSVHWVLVVGIW